LLDWILKCFVYKLEGIYSLGSLELAEMTILKFLEIKGLVYIQKSA